MKIFAVFGDPIAHSISPRLHNLALGELGLDALYTRYRLTDGSQLAAKFKELGLSGANVTIPHKEVALALCDHADEAAAKIGSVNTLVLKNSQIYGYNTDAPGFLRAIKPFGEIKTALVLGAGGTARAISYALKNAGAKVTILNRSKARLANFGEFDKFSWDEFDEGEFELVVNTTSAGLNDTNLPAPEQILKPCLNRAKFAFDVIYGKQTPFLNLATTHGLICKDGADMLLFQAVLALNLFYSSSLDENKIEAAMRKAFEL